jgi:glycosyltransferase involved in cell wall biosynthesis
MSRGAETGRKDLPKAPVSVIIPCYNCSETIARAMSSVANQTVLPEEVLLVEDASPDAGETLLQLHKQVSRYADVFSVRVIALAHNMGPASARNRGWDVASQPYVAFLDADDAWHPRKIEIQYAWMREHEAYGLTGHGHVCQSASVPGWPPVAEARHALRISAFGILYSNPFATRTVMVKRALPFRYAEGKRFAEDYLLWLQIVLKGVPAARIDANLAASYKADFGVSGLSANLWKMEAGELDSYWRIHKAGMIGLFALALCSSYSILKYFRRVLIASFK